VILSSDLKQPEPSAKTATLSNLCEKNFEIEKIISNWEDFGNLIQLSTSH